MTGLVSLSFSASANDDVNKQLELMQQRIKAMQQGALNQNAEAEAYQKKI